MSYNMRKRPRETIVKSEADENDHLEKDDDVQYFEDSKEENDASESNISEESDKDLSDEENEPNPKKRKASQKKDRKKKYAITKDFEVIKSDPDELHPTKLILFPNEKREFCYVYVWYNFINRYVCRGCRGKGKNTKAILHREANSSDYVKIINEEHYCEMVKYPLKSESYIIEKPDFEIIRNTVNGKEKQWLIVINLENRDCCYEFYWDAGRQKFLCSGCALFSKHISAMADEDGNSIKVSDTDHICIPRPYDPEKFSKKYEIVNSPNFKVITKFRGGKENQQLIIFHSNDSNLCYKYYFETHTQSFLCNICVRQGLRVAAKLLKNENDENYVQLNHNQHICSPKPVSPNIKEIILEASEFHFMPNEAGKPKIFILCSKNKKMCYEFTQDHRKNWYFCMGCNNKSKTRNKSFVLELCINQNGENFIRMKQQEHICESRPYQPEKYNEIIIKHPNVLFFQEKKWLKLITIHPNDSTLCYKYHYDKKPKNFLCRKCYKLGKSAKAYLHLDDDGKEYIKTTGHICEPIKLSTIKNDKNFKKLENSGLDIKKTKIISKDFFDLRRSNDGIYNGKAIIYESNDKSLFYEFGFDKTQKHYYCFKCREQGVNIIATLHHSKTFYYLELEETKHVCAPLKTETKEEKTLSSNFEILNDSKPPKLIIFASDDKKICYELYEQKNRKGFFICSPCKQLKAHVTATLMRNEKDEEYLKLSKSDHICIPKEYNPENFQGKMILPENRWELMHSFLGTPKTKLFIFDESNENLVYDYNGSKKGRNKFYCATCSILGEKVSAKLVKGNDSEEYAVELGGENHICVIENYVDKGLIIQKSQYQFQNKANGEKFLIQNHPINDGSYYEFHFDNDLKVYCCVKCKEINKRITANLCRNKNNEEYILLNDTHWCIPILSPTNSKSMSNKNLILESNFVIMHNNAGIPNARLTIFNKNNQNYAHDFMDSLHNNSFFCCGCSLKGQKTRMAKIIIKSNKEKYIELNFVKHICAIRNLLEREKLTNNPKIKFESDKKIMIVLHPNDPKFYYNFKRHETLDGYFCESCLEKGKFIEAKICKRKNEEEFLLLNDNHRCRPSTKVE